MGHHEDRIRHSLAGRLDLLEWGLELIGENFHIPNAVGTRGYVDILARDRHGIFVVIELKRSDNSARQALHEIMKYTELLQREKGLSLEDIRSIIISTEWNELLVPFSHFSRSWPFNLRGLRLELENDGFTPSVVQEVALLSETPFRALTPVHIILVGNSADACWAQTMRILKKVGADDAVGVEIRHQEHGNALYLAIGRIVPDDPRTTLLDYLSEDVPQDTIEAPEGCYLEYRALCHLTDQLKDCSPRTAYPDKFRLLIDQMGWKAHKLFRVGVFERQRDLLPDPELLRRLKGESGDSEIQFFGSSNPLNSAHWHRFRQRLSNTLFGNPAWEATVNKWLAELPSHADLSILIKVFNPCDLTSAWVYGWPKRVQGYLPELQAAVDAPPPVGKLLSGTLSWAVQTDVNIEHLVQEIYNSPAQWALHRNLGSVWEEDLRLLERLGLKYILVEFSEGYPDGALLEVENSRLTRRPPDRLIEGAPAWEGIRPLSDFFQRHHQGIEQAVQWFRKSMLQPLDDDGPPEATYIFVDPSLPPQ